MASATNAQVIFNEHPEDYPVPDRTVRVDKSVINLGKEPLNGGVLVKLLVLSIDPYLRGLMNKTSPYRLNGPTFKIGEPIFASGISKVIRSENPKFAVGDHIYGIHPFVEYAVLKDLEGYKKFENREGLPWSTYIGVCGMPGKTSHHGYEEYIKPHVKKGDTIFVSSGAGAVGSLVVQLAKLDGMKVIASAGSDDKVQFMKEIGTDVPFNYKTTNTKEILEKHGPINFYWDNVGGDTLDCALDSSAQFAHIVVCGQISGYNDQPKPIHKFAHVLWKSLTINGFLVGNLYKKYESQFRDSIPPKVASGELKHEEDVRRGLESVGQALFDVQAGKNKGKLVVVVADD